MERKFESGNSGEHRAGMMSVASESFMANLPIIICGLVVGAAAAFELLSL